MTVINLPVSIGEGLDKLAILKIKATHIKVIEKLHHINNEIDLISPLLLPFITDNIINILYNDLVYINQRIWDLVDIARDKGTTDPIVMKENDARFRIKNRINVYLQSSIQEQKNTNSTSKKFYINTLKELHENIEIINNERLYIDNILIYTTTPELKDEINNLFKYNTEIKVI
jgi:hypothetical protein